MVTKHIRSLSISRHQGNANKIKHDETLATSLMGRNNYEDNEMTVLKRHSAPFFVW